MRICFVPGLRQILARRSMAFAAPEHRVLVNSALQLQTHGIRLVSSLLLAVLVGRFWGVDALGYYTSITVVAGLLSFLFDPGLSGLLLREVARDPSKTRSLLSTALALLTLGALPSAIVTTLLAWLVVGGGAATAAAALASSAWLVVGGYNAALTAIFHAMARMDLETKIVAVERMIALLLAVVVIATTRSMFLLIGALVVARIAALAINLVSVRKIVGASPLDFDRAATGRMLAEGVPFWSHNLFTILYAQQSVLLLTLLSSSREVGLYQSAAVIYQQAPLVATTFNRALFPSLARAWQAHDRFTVMRGLRVSLVGTITSGILLALASALAAEPLITALYGEAFTPAVVAFGIFALAMPFAFVNSSLGTGLTVMGRQRLRASVSLVGVVLSVGLNLVLIPRYGYLGAAAETPITGAVMVALLGIGCRRVVREWRGSDPPDATRSGGITPRS
jgi:O-antigen/teichoic acid export membrane protein